MIISSPRVAVPKKTNFRMLKLIQDVDNKMKRNVIENYIFIQMITNIESTTL